MKPAKKAAIIVAVSFVVIGLLLSFGALVAMDFDFTKMNTMTLQSKVYSIEESFTDIFIEDAESDVRLIPTQDGSCTVICQESDKISHSVTVKNGKLTVERTDLRKWYERIGIYWGEMEVLIYLPKTEYDRLSVSNVSGTVEVPKEFSFVQAEIDNTSGDVRFLASVQNKLSVKTVSGDIRIADTACQNVSAESTSGEILLSNLTTAAETLRLKTVSGDIRIAEITCQNVSAESTSGEILLSNTTASETFWLKTVSGNVGLRNCDAGDLWIKTTSGEVSGTLLTEKVFLTDTSSGEVSVPKTASGGKCEIKTTSGDIDIKIK